MAKEVVKKMLLYYFLPCCPLPVFFLYCYLVCNTYESKVFHSSNTSRVTLETIFKLSLSAFKGAAKVFSKTSIRRGETTNFKNESLIFLL